LNFEVINATIEMEVRMQTFEEFLADFEKTASPEYFEAKIRHAPMFAFEVQRLRLARAVRETRKQHGMTQRELAAKSGVQQREIVRIEKGAGNPTLMTQVKLQFALGINL
jgi:XRE family transcriptional regulator, regulator of sulfur utilization